MSSDGDDTLKIRCPVCNGWLVVDRQSGEVLEAMHADKTPVDFDSAVEDVHEGQRRREDEFKHAFQSEMSREQTLEKKFERARERTRGDAPPKNPLDDL